MKIVNKYRNGIVLGVVLAGFMGCESPLVPSWEVEMRIPAIEDTLSVNDYLPAPIIATDDAFLLPDTSFEYKVKLKDACGDCLSEFVVEQGVYPILKYRGEVTLPFPDAFVAAEFIDGVLKIELNHPLPYDLLRSPNGVYGSISIELADTNNVIYARQIISGETTSFLRGDTLEIVLPLDGLKVTKGDRFYLSVYSPGATGVTESLDLEGVLEVRGGAFDIKLSSISAGFSGMMIRESFVGALDAKAKETLRRPDVTTWASVGVRHPFDFSGVFDVVFGSLVSGDSVVVAKHYWSLDTGGFDASLMLTPEQIRRLLDGDSVYVAVSGEILPGILTVRAGDRIFVSAELGTYVDMK